MVMPDGERTGGLDIVGTGGSITLSGGTGVSRGRINTSGTIKDLVIVNQRFDMGGPGINDAIDLVHQGRSVLIHDCRLVGIHGQHKSKHGDGIQVQLGARIDQLAIVNVTVVTSYQGVMTWRSPDGTGLGALVLSRVNVRQANIEPQDSGTIAYYLGDDAGSGGGKAADYRISFDDVWAEPRPNDPQGYHRAYPHKWLGSVKTGVPPGGDFCPAR